MTRDLASWILMTALAGSAGALVRGDSAPGLAGRQFAAAGLEFADRFSRVEDLSSELRLAARAALLDLGVAPDAAIVETRGGRWAALYPVLPMIPGDGRGNSLTWGQIGMDQPADDRALAEQAWTRVAAYLAAHGDSLGIDLAELVHRSAVHNDGRLIQFHADRLHQGLPVRGAAFTAVLSHGNLALMGSNAWGDIDLDLAPSISAARARARVREFLAPFAIATWRAAGRLEILPVGTAGETVGRGLLHRLVWVVQPEVTGDRGRWEALVDAHDGELLSFRDLNSYGGARNVNGGVYPLSYDQIGPDGMMQDNYPMPYADVTVGGPFTDAGGNFSGAGNATTTLQGKFIRIVDQCSGTFSESGTGDIELGGVNGDVDCDTPTTGDNTAAARSGFYELNRMVEQAQSHLPGNAWLQSQVTANMNLDDTCDAFWGGATVNFFRSGEGCANTGQIAGVFDHEWGHGLDDNDTQGSIISAQNGGGEGIADIYGALRLDTSCVGRGFCQGTSFCSGGQFCPGYGDPCTPVSGCSGIRTVDYEQRASGLPHTLTWTQTHCGAGSGETHCNGSTYAEAIWDLYTRDLPARYGLDATTSLELTTHLTYIAANVVNGWYAFSGAPHANCSATFSYKQLLIADDDNGDLNDGTPHMTAIFDAYDRLEIDCSPANGGPTVQDGGCPGTPTSAPVLAVSGTDMGAQLSWSPVGGATAYNVYRTDGLFGCDYGKTLAATTGGTTFTDGGLKNGHPYYYTVIPLGAGPTCLGPASNCSPVGSSEIFADGFESGDVGAWDHSVP